MLLVQTLARLGVGHLIVIDAQRVDPTNLPRPPEATHLDGMALVDPDSMPGVYVVGRPTVLPP